MSPFEEFVRSESAGGITLIVAALAAFAWANSPLAPSYSAMRDIHLGVGLAGLEFDESLLHWVNDGLMALFFLLVGLEIKREVLTGGSRPPGTPPSPWWRPWAAWSCRPGSTWRSTGVARG